ncbi:MAG: AAA family ATPase [Candidatus Levybacteria bacterium]|nr:AAA family ATPase [Candidatus Levybacteria bacterium]
MVNAGQMEKVLKKIYEVDAKLICIGDDNQIKGHVVSDIFRGLKETVGFVSLTNIIRQKVDWMKQASLQLSNHQHVEALKAYQDHGHIEWLKDEKKAMEKMAADFAKDLMSKVDSRILAYTKREVKDLNLITRDLLVKNGHLEEGSEFKVKLTCLETEKVIKTKIRLSVGDRIIIERNENSGVAAKTLKNAKRGIDGVKTGDVGDILAVDKKKNKITVRLFDHKNIEKRRVVEIDLNEFNHINYGYAMTTDRSEGKTWVASYVLTSIGMSLNRLYVALSRHTHNVKMYMNLEKSKDLKQYIDKVGKVEKKHLVRDYTRDDKEVYKNRVREYQNLASEWSQLRAEIDKLSSDNIRKDKGMGNFNEHPAYEYFVELSEAKQKIAKEIVQDWDNHKVFAQTEKMRYDWLLIESGEAPKVTPDDKRQKEFFKLYRDIVYATTDVSAKSVEQFDAFMKVRQLMAAKIASEMSEYNKFTSIFRKNGVLVDCFFDKITKFPVSQDLIMNDAHNFEKAATLEEKAHVLDMEVGAFDIKGIRDSLISAFPDAQLKKERKEAKLSPDVIPENRSEKAAKLQSQTSPALKPKSVTEELIEGVSETKTKILAEEQTMQNTDYRKESDYQDGLKKQHKSYDLDAVKEKLEDRVEDLARHVFSSEKYVKRHGNEIRFGQKGGISVYISGPKKGGWVNYKTGVSGKAFDLLTKEMGMDFKNALDYGANFVGISPEQNNMSAEEMMRRHEAALKGKMLKQEQEAANWEKEISKKVGKVKTIYKETTPIMGTLAQTYLQKHRGIESNTFSDNLRFHPNYYSSETKQSYPALVSFARDVKGELKALQAIYLNDKGEKHQELETKKRSFGPLTGSFVTIQAGDRNAPIFVAEGVETALSVKEAGVNGTIVAALGISNIKNLECQNKDVIICKDNDGQENKTHETIENTRIVLEEKAAKVTIIQPSRAGEDFNDVLTRDGKDFVKILFKDFIHERKDWRQEKSQEYIFAETKTAIKSQTHGNFERNSTGQAAEEKSSTEVSTKLDVNHLTEKEVAFIKSMSASPETQLKVTETYLKVKADNIKLAAVSKNIGKAKDFGVDI